MSEWRRIYIRTGTGHIGYVHQGGQPTSEAAIRIRFLRDNVLVDLPNLKITKNGDQINLIWRVP